jgi:cephalosporin hydroxylase
MYPFWEMVVAPLVKASGARRVLEIGALRGETTSKMFDQLGPDSELHVIDPLPQFDPDEHAREFPGRYLFHRALSLDVLPDLPAVDVALVDGDHNWYTVYHELQLLDRTAREAGQPLPLLVLHDVGWPYGHRDLYYEPSQIPEEFRQPYRRAGIAPGHFRVLDEGGFNATLHNALSSGGPRNGVMCALEDFLAEYDRPYRRALFAFYFGLAVVVDEERLAQHPEIGEVLDSFETPMGRERLLRLSERIRIDEQVHVHNWNRILEERIDDNKRRYLDLLKDVLLDVHYFENEVRIAYLASLPAGTPPDLAKLRDPARDLEVRYARMAEARRRGRSTDGARTVGTFPYADSGRLALDHLEAVVASIADHGVPGDVVDCGVGRGGSGLFARAVLDVNGLEDRMLWMVDPYVASLPGTEIDTTPRGAQVQADLNQVRDAFHRFGLLDDRTRFVQGTYDAATADTPPGPIAVLRVGMAAAPQADLLLPRLLPRMAPGGTVIVHGVGAAPAEAKVRATLQRLGATDQITRVDRDTITWKVGVPASASVDIEPASIHRTPLAPARTTDTIDLTVVVVFYNMAREAKRTLTSLSRSYQEGIADLRYEVIVIDNGSTEGRLTAEEVATYGPEFRLLDMGDDAPSSPTVAMNLAIAQSRGDAVALMIDGAHVLTPGVFKYALQALDVYEPAVVAVQQWYVGPGQQSDAFAHGYEQGAEDQLFNRIGWPADGYRLFEIGHFIGDRDWFDGIIESNCVFVPRSLLEQIGGIDDSYDMPSGGYVNLELFERLQHHPGVTPATVLGEGSFHQYHGGTTTNVADEAERRAKIARYTQDFRDRRGRSLQGSNKPMHYVGTMATKAARRTRSRREFLLAFDAKRDPVTTTEVPPRFIPDELKVAAIEAIWEHQSWRETSWLGRPVRRYPTDLQTAQEVVSRVRPEVVVLLAEDDGLAGRALYMASVLDGLGAGRVVVAGPKPDEPPVHPRVELVEGRPDDTAVVAAVAELVAGQRALVFLALGATERVLSAFEAYAPLVPVESYLVVENTVVNGRPVVPGFGPGPHEAVNAILQTHREFVPDVSCERYTITFNRSGYLRRMAGS